MSEAAVRRHAKHHLPAELLKAREAEDLANADDLLGQIRQLQCRAMKVLDRAEAVEDFKAATAAIGQSRGCLQLLGRMLGELEPTREQQSAERVRKIHDELMGDEETRRLLIRLHGHISSVLRPTHPELIGAARMAPAQPVSDEERFAEAVRLFEKARERMGRPGPS